MTHISVVVPVYNESSLIKELVKQVKANVKLITEDFEIILVDDGSQDQTWELIESEARQEKRLKGIKFSRNFGHHYAITAGLHNSKGEWVVVMDGDLQDRPEVIPDLYNKAQSGFDVVFVSRQNRPENIFYRILQKFFYFLLRILSGINFDSSQANYSIINERVVKAFRNFPENTRFYGSTILWLGFKRTKLDADHGSRHSGKSSYSIKKRFKLASDIILSSSERPLKIGILLGLSNTVAAFFGVLWITYSKITWGYSIIGWPSIIVLILYVGGLILIVLGLLGIYIGKIYNETKGRPLYVISKETQ